MICKYCKKPYVENKSLGMLKEILTPKQLEKIKMIPDCNCLEEKEQEKMIQEERELAKIRIKNKVNKFKSISVVDSKFEEANFDNADMTDEHMGPCLRYAKKLVIEPTSIGMLLYGRTGNGKTFASACIGNHLMNAGKTVLALSLSNYLTKLREFKQEDEARILKGVADCDLLIIDDMGSENITPWVLEKIFVLIDTRYRSKKPMIISTNLNFSKNEKECELTKAFSMDGKDRITDRVKEMCFPILVKGGSRRKVERMDFMEFLGYGN